MMIVMSMDASGDEIQAVLAKVESMGLTPHLSQGEERAVIGVIGDRRKLVSDLLLHQSGVERIVPISPPYKLASRDFHPWDSTFEVGGVPLGRGGVVIIAGPCSVEDRGQLLETAHAVQEAGASMLRGGAYKPRTSPYSFQGLGDKGLEVLAEARQQTGLPIVTEVMQEEKVELVARYADMLQIGARNMQNFPLLHAVAKSKRPVLLKRGISATIEELLMAAEHILSKGNPHIALCERGIRSFETATRNTTDINAIPVLKHRTHLPVILDPSHSTGHWQLVSPVAMAGVAAGADGVMVEVHVRPDQALSDGGQSLKPERFAELVSNIVRLSEALGRQPRRASRPVTSAAAAL